MMFRKDECPCTGMLQQVAREFAHALEGRRGCGCSYTHPCPGGCIWATHDLCSACVQRGVT